jgi:uncharacterized protein (TIGR00369 family)
MTSPEDERSPDPIDGREPPIASLLGRRVIAADVEQGIVEVEFRAREGFRNSTGTIQGGMLAAMLDSTLGPALRAALPPHDVAPTLELKVSFLRPAYPGRLVGHGRIRHRTRSVAFLEGELRNDAGEVVATASATFRIRRRAEPEGERP